MGMERVIAINAETLKQMAREHKSASRYHRERAREAMQRLEELQRIASELGIKLEIEAKGESHGPEKENSHP